MRDRSPVDCVTAGAGRRQPRIGRAALAAFTLAAASAVVLGATATSASAATPKWGYEQVSPSDKSSVDIFGTDVSEDGSTVLGATLGAEIPGMPTDGRATGFQYGMPRGGEAWPVGPFGWHDGVQAFGYYADAISADGSQVMRTGVFTPYLGGPYFGTLLLNAAGEAVDLKKGGSVVYNQDFSAFAFLQNYEPLGIHLVRPGQDPVLASVDNAGNPMTPVKLGAANRTTLMGSNNMFSGNAMAVDGSSVIFASTDALPGDDDGGREDLYRRVLTPGQEETYSVTDANGSSDVDSPFGDAEYRWATADQSRVFFVTNESLEPGDTDGEQDVYMRDGRQPPVRLSQGETVDGSPTGNGPQPFGYLPEPEWVSSSDDGNRTFFLSEEQLTQDAPVEGAKLYERDVEEGRTRLVSRLALRDIDIAAVFNVGAGALRGQGPNTPAELPSSSFLGIRVTPTGAVFMSSAALAGADDDGKPSVFKWTRGESVVRVGKPESDAPPSPPGFETIVPFPFPDVSGAEAYHPHNGGRAISDDGSQVFFSTNQALTEEDTDGTYRDLYVWSEAEGVRLVSPPGHDRYDVNYIDSSPDGSEVFFATRAGILPSDTDPNAIDVYVAVLGGGLPASPQVPDADPRVCEGDACQGPNASATPPTVGSVSFTGSGNVLAPPDPIVPSVSVSKIKAVAGSAAALKIRVPAAGQISVSGSSLRRAERSAPKAGSYSVKVALSARGKSTLRKKKTVKVRVRVSYRAQEGPAASKSVSVTFKQPKARKSSSSKKGGR